MLRDPDLLGRPLDSFVVAQLRPELAVSDRSPRLYHLRQQDEPHEVDLIVELAGGRIIAIKVKAASAPSRFDARPLIWLREHLGDRVLAALVLHAGPHLYPLGDEVYAVPSGYRWAP